MLRFHTQTAGVTLTAQQPDNNVIRSTVQAMAAILGGTQSLHVNSRDEALGLPTEESAQLSLRTQQIIAHESGVADVVDPLGGSWYVESLTDQLEQRALEYISEIDRQGGAVAAIEQGYQVREIGESAYRHQREVDTADRTVVGVNRYLTDEPPLGNLLRVDPEVARQQAERLANCENPGTATRSRHPWPGWKKWPALPRTPFPPPWNAWRITAPWGRFARSSAPSLGNSRGSWRSD